MLFAKAYLSPVAVKELNHDKSLQIYFCVKSQANKHFLEVESTVKTRFHLLILMDWHMLDKSFFSMKTHVEGTH